MHTTRNIDVVCVHVALRMPCLVHVLQSAKLRQAQEQNNNLTKEKETLMQAVQDLQARIKQGARPHHRIFSGGLLVAKVLDLAANAYCSRKLHSGLQSVQPAF